MESAASVRTMRSTYACSIAGDCRGEDAAAGAHADTSAAERTAAALGRRGRRALRVGSRVMAALRAAWGGVGVA
jgi:hypothetical protein